MYGIGVYFCMTHCPCCTAALFVHTLIRSLNVYTFMRSRTHAIYTTCNHAVSSGMQSCQRDHAMQSCQVPCAPVGSLQEVISKLAKHICQHVLTPLLRLHPYPVCFQTHLQRDLDEGSYTIEVSYSVAGRQQGEEERCSVESAVLQCLQVLKRRAHNFTLKLLTLI